MIKNTDTSTKTLTMDVVGIIGGLTPADTTVTVPAAASGAPGYAFVHFRWKPSAGKRQCRHRQRDRRHRCRD